MTTLGEGTYCDMLRVYPPPSVLIERRYMRRLSFRIDGPGHHPGIGYDEFVGSVAFADSTNADMFSFHPRRPDRILCMPEDVGDHIVAVDACSIRFDALF